MPELVHTEKGLALRQGNMELRGDFEPLLRRLRPQNLSHELLVRAARVKGVDHPRAVDATAGLGEDSLLLAAAGFFVELYERDETIAALLRDALERASCHPQLAPIVARMELHEADSVLALREMQHAPHVVLLDPMFPERKKSSSVKKKLQLIQLLERPCSNESELLDAAVAPHPQKVVIKRPAKGAPLAGVRPSYSLSGKAVRYDVIVVPR